MLRFQELTFGSEEIGDCSSRGRMRGFGEFHWNMKGGSIREARQVARISK